MTEKEEKIYKCRYCGREYKSNVGRWKHEKKCPQRPKEEEEIAEDEQITEEFVDEEDEDGITLFDDEDEDEEDEDDEDGEVVYVCPECGYEDTEEFEECPECGVEIEW